MSSVTDSTLETASDLVADAKPWRLEQIRVVLVRSQHPGNIGAAARAMKNMGLRDLVLVQPRLFPHDEALAMAAGASDLLSDCRVTSSLADAVQGCGRVFAATARDRRANWRVTEASEMGQRLQSMACERVAIVFGPERTGLDNQDLDLCHEIVTIDADPSYPAMNLAGAVQILAYALRQGLKRQEGEGCRESEGEHKRRMPRHEQVEALHQQLARMLSDAAFFDERTNPTLGLRRLRILFNRADLDQKELQMLRGVFTTFEQRMREKAAD